MALSIRSRGGITQGRDDCRCCRCGASTRAPVASSSSSALDLLPRAHATSSCTSPWLLGRRVAPSGPASHSSVACRGTQQLTGSIVRLGQDSNGSSDFRWGSFLSSLPTVPDAVAEAVQATMASIGPDAQPQLAIVFVTSEYSAEFDLVVPTLRQLLPSLKHIIGCSGYGVTGGSPDGPREVEGDRALSLTLGQLPGVELHAFHTLRSGIPKSKLLGQWSDFVRVPHDTNKEVSFIVLSDPRFSQVSQIIEGLDHVFPSAPKIGGILSHGPQPLDRALFAWNSPDALPSLRSSSRGADAGRGARRRGRGAGAKGGARSGGRSAAARKPTAAQADIAEQWEALQRSSEAADSKKQSIGADHRQSGGSAADAEPASREGESSGRNSSSGDSQDKGGGGGFFGALWRMFTGERTDGRESPSSTPQGSAAATRSRGSSSLGLAPALQRGLRLRGAATAATSASASDTSSNGLYLHGAVCLAIHGNVKMETIASLGFRAPNNRLYRVLRSHPRRNEVLVIAPDDPKAVPLRKTTFSVELDSDDDEDNNDDDEFVGDDADFNAAEALFEMALALRLQQQAAETAAAAVMRGDWEVMLAVARDCDKVSDDLGPEDFELIPVTAIGGDERTLLYTDKAPRIQEGDRFKVMIRDKRGIKQDLKDRVVDYKRRDLQAMVSGSGVPPTIGSLVFSAMERGATVYPPAEDGPSAESRIVASYVPAPLAGLFAGVQVVRVGNRHMLCTNACVVGVLRATLPPADSHGSGSATAASAASAAATTTESNTVTDVEAGSNAQQQSAE